MHHHELDINPVPKEKGALFVNEPWLVDKSLLDLLLNNEPGPEDNVRIYVPIDLSKEAILRRLGELENHYKDANYKNESEYRIDVDLLVSQIEIYDQVWYARHMTDGKHSNEAIELVKEFVERLEGIPDACAERFPFDIIEELREEYLGLRDEEYENI